MNVTKLLARHAPCKPSEAERRANGNIVAMCLTALAIWLAMPEPAQAQSIGFNFPILDTFFCGFITYAKSKLAPYIAVTVIMMGVIGHWLGATKVWGTLLYVAVGLGVILGIGSLIASATGAGATCLT